MCVYIYVCIYLCVYMYVCICVYVHVSTNVYTGAREAGDDSVIIEALNVFLYVSLYMSLCVPLYTGAREAGDAGGPREGKGVHRHVCKVFLFFFFLCMQGIFFLFFLWFVTHKLLGVHARRLCLPSFCHPRLGFRVYYRMCSLAIECVLFLLSAFRV